MTLPLVSVIINTKNEEKNIKACLESVKRRKFNDDERQLVTP